MIRTTVAMPCPVSLDTVVPVNRCPRNKLEWDARAALFNCSSINQTCQFEYHCVLNEDCTALVELCAPPIPIHGIILFHALILIDKYIFLKKNEDFHLKIFEI